MGFVSLYTAFSGLQAAQAGMDTAVGGATAGAFSEAASQSAVSQSAQNARTQMHGVSIDEEMVNLLTYQRAHEAASRVMTADLEAALLANDQSGIDTGIGELQSSMDSTLTTLTGLGAVGSRIEGAKLRIGDDIAALRAQLSNVEDVDLAEAVLEMQLQEAAYTAALGAFARSSQTSLLDFLR